MTTKIPVELSSTPGIVDGSNATAITIDSSENVGIGTTSPSRVLHTQGASVLFGNTSGAHEILFGDSAHRYFKLYTPASPDYASIRTGTTDILVAHSDGNVGIGNTNPGDYSADANNLVVGSLTGNNGITIASNSNSSYGSIYFADATTNNKVYSGFIRYQQNQSNLTFGTNEAERMRLNASEFQIFKSDSNTATIGVFIQSNGRYIGTTNSNLEPMILNRQHSDGDLMEFRHANSVEGSISVSGSTVSYNGFSGRHETSGIANNIAVGTVVSTIDALDTHSDTGEDREDHAKVKVSDTVGDSRVYGVLAEYSDKTNKPMVASVGIGSVKVTGACSGGDLLESNGDGTAKVQSDDIVRSKTIGKVTIGNSETGVKLVSCVLYCG